MEKKIVLTLYFDFNSKEPISINWFAVPAFGETILYNFYRLRVTAVQHDLGTEQIKVYTTRN